MAPAQTVELPAKARHSLSVLRPQDPLQGWINCFFTSVEKGGGHIVCVQHESVLGEIFDKSRNPLTLGLCRVGWEVARFRDEWRP